MNEQFRRRAKRNDRIARWVITLAGLAVIFSVILILVLITNVTLPLFQKPDAKVYAKFKDTDSSAQTRFLAIGVDDYRQDVRHAMPAGPFSGFRAPSRASRYSLWYRVRARGNSFSKRT